MSKIDNLVVEAWVKESNEGKDKVAVPSLSSVTVIWLVVPVMKEVMSVEVAMLDELMVNNLLAVV